ncbi:hypothetical protein FNF31_02017 [Cafeteria roenbergensis]|uniref:Uncharacterized protein n=1 Tax=Cafeteria roenbergensis TaxID=33653 RepID=A0A5A8DIV7_CAFRO|nr:hypothetical protein FNF31_02017 [Cafeteria roenbergensis]
MANARRSEALRAEKKRFSSLPKAFLYVRVGFEGDASTIKQIPRYRLDKETLDHLFRCDVVFLQEERSGAVVMPETWKNDCLPLPALYYIRESVQPKLEPDALEDGTYRGSVGVFCLDVPDQVDQESLQAWLSAGLDDDDPELVAARLRIEEASIRLKDVRKQLIDAPTAPVAGSTLDEIKAARVERARQLRAQVAELEPELAHLEERMRRIIAGREGDKGRGFTARLVETVLPLRFNAWEIKFEEEDRGRRLAYVATHKLNWADFALAMSKRGIGKPMTQKGPWAKDQLPESYTAVTMRGVRVVRLQHGRGMYKFRDERGFYSGQWRLGRRHGLGVEINAQGRYTGRLEREWRRGEGTLVFANGDVYRGTFGTPGFHEKMSLLHGDEYMDGMPHGAGNIKFVDGSEFTGEFSSGQPHGQGELTDASGSRWKGHFGSLSLMDGVGSSAVGDLTQSGTWRDGQLHGRGIVLDRAIGKYVGSFAYGLRHGHGETDATECDARYYGMHKLGFRHGRGLVNIGNVHRDAARRAARRRVASEGGGSRARVSPRSIVRASAAATNSSKLASLTGPPQSDAEARMEALEADLAALRSAPSQQAIEGPCDDPESGDPSSEGSVPLAGSIPYRGDVMYEGLWRANLNRDGGVITHRLGRPEPHHHHRWFPTRRVQSSIIGARLLAQKEQSVAFARAKAQQVHTKEVLTRRLEKEADNLRSFAYWQQVAQSRLAAYKQRTAAKKKDLSRVKQQLARPDELILPSRTIASVGDAADMSLYAESLHGPLDDQGWQGLQEGPRMPSIRSSAARRPSGRVSWAAEGPARASAASRRSQRGSARVSFASPGRASAASAAAASSH